MNDVNNAVKAKIAYFNELGPNWDQIVGNDGERLEALRRVFDMVTLRENDTVLDVGCGNGVLFKLILERIGENGRLTAIDSSETMISRARELHKNYFNIEYINISAESADFENDCFDVILCFAVFPHIDDKKNALFLFNRILKKTGKLYIFHLSDTESLNRFHSTLDAPVRIDMMPHKDEFETMLSGTSFRISEYIDQEGLNFIECKLC